MLSDTQTILSEPKSGLPDCITNLILTLLTPIFLFAAGGDVAFARLAANETLDSYRADTHADLITVAKIIAFGLAALDSLSRSMQDDLPISQILRLRSSANAADRAEHRNRLALRQTHPDHPVTPAPDPEPAANPAAIAATTTSQPDTAWYQAPASPQRPELAPSPATAEQQYAETWAASAARIAAETAAEMPNLAPDERRSAGIWIEALKDAAKEFKTAGIPPRPSPGDLAALMHPTRP
jgi:hypothetical protein